MAGKWLSRIKPKAPSKVTDRFYESGYPPARADGRPSMNDVLDAGIKKALKDKTGD